LSNDPKISFLPNVAVVIPCYRVSGQVLTVLSSIPDVVSRIYCIDDSCPEKTGQLIVEKCNDPRVEVLFHEANQGVGGATITGYLAALREDMDFIVKIDGDGQMDPGLIPRFLYAVEAGEADYCKGNRFYRPATLFGMPKRRIIGNAILSFLTKMSSGYWNIIDPTNGYTVIHAPTLRLLPIEMIDRTYFFESDMLFRLNTISAVVRDIPMLSVYENEKSNLKIRKIVRPFLIKHCKNFLKRIMYSYYLRDFNLASFEWPLGIGFLTFGFTFGLYQWIVSYLNAVNASAGTVMLAALSIIIGMQMLLSAFNFDIQNVPKTPLQKLFRDENPLSSMSENLSRNSDQTVEKTKPSSTRLRSEQD